MHQGQGCIDVRLCGSVYWSLAALCYVMHCRLYRFVSLTYRGACKCSFSFSFAVMCSACAEE